MPDLNERIALAAERLGVVAAERRHVVVTAESCTGGGIAAAITEVPGSSAWFREGFVTYAAEAKTSLLDVDPKMIEEEGVVSEDVAQAMARGALARCPDSTLAVAVTGVAGRAARTSRPWARCASAGPNASTSTSSRTCARSMRTAAARWCAGRPCSRPSRA